VEHPSTQGVAQQAVGAAHSPSDFAILFLFSNEGNPIDDH
jgi:hypothetical protein